VSSRKGRGMSGLPATTSPEEAIWVAIGLAGLVFTIWCMCYVVPTLLAVVAAVQLRKAAYNGPRFIFVGWFLVALLMLALVWLFFLLPGLLAATIPPPPTPERQQEADLLVTLLICGEWFLLATTGAIFFAWRQALKAPSFRAILDGGNR
jgi:hypothetical protein